MKTTSIIIVLLFLTASVGIASATYTKEIIKTQYHPILAQFGIGEILYKITDNDIVSYQLERNEINLKFASVISQDKTTVKILPGKSWTWIYGVSGCCRVMDNQDSHVHILLLSNADTGEVIGNAKNYEVNSNDVADGSWDLGIFNTAGVYKYKIKETIKILGSDGNWLMVNGNTAYLTIDVGTPADTTPPASVTNLVESSTTENSITWKWTNPSDSDFSKIEIYLNDALQTKVTSGVESYTASGLSADTTYILGTKTIDSTGNVNPTMVKDSATTQKTKVTETPGQTPGTTPGQTPGTTPGQTPSIDQETQCPSGYVWSEKYETCRPLTESIADKINPKGDNTVYIIVGAGLIAGLYLLKRKDIKW